MEKHWSRASPKFDTAEPYSNVYSTERIGIALNLLTAVSNLLVALYLRIFMYL